MKIAVIVCWLVLTGIISHAVFYRWDKAANRGYRFGYYGEFNTVSNGLASIPGVIVTNSWYNPDMWIEEFAFGITFNGRPARVDIPENDRIRTMNSDALSSALRSRIQPVSNRRQ